MPRMNGHIFQGNYRPFSEYTTHATRQPCELEHVAIHRHALYVITDFNIFRVLSIRRVRHYVLLGASVFSRLPLPLFFFLSFFHLSATCFNIFLFIALLTFFFMQVFLYFSYYFIIFQNPTLCPCR